MPKIKRGDFIELEYTAKTADGYVFDTTDASVAKSAKLEHSHFAYKPQVVCVGEKHILPGLDAELVGKETGQSYTISLSAEKAFGKKNPKLIRMIPTSAFKKHDVRPFPGITVNIDGIGGVIRTVTGGRIIVDFNHPLAGKDVLYEIKVNKIVDDEEKKVESLLKAILGIKPKILMKDGKAVVTIPADIPKEIAEDISKKVASLTNTKAVEFKVEETKKVEKVRL